MFIFSEWYLGTIDVSYIVKLIYYDKVSIGYRYVFSLKERRTY